MALSLTQATEIGHLYASVVTWSDPGVSLYAFASTGRVQSEDHRANVLDYLAAEAIPSAQLCDLAGDAETVLGGSNVEDVRALEAFVRGVAVQ